MNFRIIQNQQRKFSRFLGGATTTVLLSKTIAVGIATYNIYTVSRTGEATCGQVTSIILAAFVLTPRSLMYRNARITLPAASTEVGAEITMNKCIYPKYETLFTDIYGEPCDPITNPYVDPFTSPCQPASQKCLVQPCGRLGSCTLNEEIVVSQNNKVTVKKGATSAWVKRHDGELYTQRGPLRNANGTPWTRAEAEAFMESFIDKIRAELCQNPSQTTFESPVFVNGGARQSFWVDRNGNNIGGVEFHSKKWVTH